MDYESYYRVAPILDSDEYILDTKKGDIDGDGVKDEVYLVGTRTGGIAVSNIRVYVHYSKTGKDLYIDLKSNKGYAPNVVLSDFTGDKADDILVSISSGNTGLEGFYYVYSLTGGVAKKIFDYEEFNQRYKYDVTYENHYTVKVASKFNDKVYTINLQNKGSSYLSALYNSDGTLKKPLYGMVSPLIELNPISRGTNSSYDLYAVQRIIGYYNADILGEIVTPLMWNGSQFTLIDNNQFLS